MLVRLGSLVAFVALAATAPARGNAKPDDEVEPRISVGAGVGFPQLLHLHIGVWVVPQLSIDTRAWVFPGPFGDAHGADAALTGHLFEGRDKLLLQVGAARLFDERPDMRNAQFVAVGWERRWICWDVRLAGGLMLARTSDDRIVDGEVVRDTNAVILPTITLTLSRRFPAPSCDSAAPR